LDIAMSRYLPGDIVSRRKGFVMHKGIALGDGRVLHNTPFRGEHITTEHEFRNGERLRVVRQDRTRRQRALAHADGLGRGRGYNLLTNNCEHTVHRASTGAARSPQLIGWAAGLAVGAVALAVTRHPVAAVAGFEAARRWVSRKPR
jgi:hypothetical protein